MGVIRYNKLQQERQVDAQEEGTLVVKTQTEDGGSQATENDGSVAFSKYYNENVWMMHLLGLDDAEASNEDIVDWQELTGYQRLDA